MFHCYYKSKHIIEIMIQRDIKKIDKTILDNFYKLVHTQQNVRLTAASSTYKILATLKKRKPNAFNEHLNYCIDRLVTGLASSRALARQGYGALLLELLNNYQISTERLLVIAQNKFGNISNETTRDNLLAYFLLITIVLESGNYKKGKSNIQCLEKIYKYLIQLKNIKSYFDYPVSKLLSSYYELFHVFLLADVPPHAFGADAKISQTELLVITLCNKKEPLRDFLNLDAPGLLNLSSSLLDEKMHRRPLHPIWMDHSRLVMKHLPQHFDAFCSKFLFPLFFKPNHNEHASLGLELISGLVVVAENTNLIRILLSDYVIRLLILSLRSRSSLYKYCVGFFKSLSQSFEKNLKCNESLAHDRCYFILSRLTSAPGSVAFDEDSKSSSIASLLNSSSPNVLKRYLDKLITLLGKKFSTEEAKRFHQACAKQIAHIIQRPQMAEEHAITQKLAKFLLMNSLFKPKDSAADETTFWTENSIPQPISPRHDSTREALRRSYHATMGRIVSCTTIQRIELMSELVDFSNQLFKLDSLELVDEDSRKNISTLWSYYMTCLKRHRKLVMKQKESKQLLPITNLFMFYGLQIVEYGLDCKTQLDELAQSGEEACKGDPNDGSWADVLTDQIIAILSATECSPWIRRLCVSVFGSLLPHISETSIDLLCDVIRAPLEGGDDGEDDESMSIDGEENSSIKSDTHEDDEKMSVGGEEDTLAGGDEEEGEGKGEEKEEEEEYLDDEQMMKLDSVLADMFKLNRVGKKKRRDPSFKLRCLDLVKKVILKKRNDSEIMKKILATLVPLEAKSRRSVETRPIADKISTLIQSCPNFALKAATLQQ